MGKRQVGELEPTELVAAILISDLASVPMQDIGIPLLSGVVPILTLLALELLSAQLSLKSIRFRTFLCGKPAFLIVDGHIDQQAMARNQLSLDELDECLRQNGILDVRQVQYAILETNGRVSTFLYPANSPLTAGDAGKDPEAQELPVTVISDGRMLTENLSMVEKDADWLKEVLTREQVEQSQVFLLTATRSGEVHLVRKEAMA